MKPRNRIPPELRQAVLRYLSERLEATTISTAEAVRTVRRRVPRSGAVTDRDLANLIADTAVEAGFYINFNGTGTIQ